MIDLEKYRLGEELGRGGVAVVYKGYHKILNKPVAIKVMHDQFTTDDEFVQRFINGARSAALLKHPNIIDVSDVGQEQGVYYIVMEYLEGETLEERIKRTGPMPEKEIEKLIRPLAEALDYAHEKGVIHRDIKSANVFLRSNGRVVLMDFDIAKASEITQNLTVDGTMLGTPAYMSPEQAMGQKSTHRSDIYSLGVIMYEMATGELPFKGESPLSILRQITMDPPPRVCDINPVMSEDLQKKILWCMEKKPEDRPSKAGELFGGDDLGTLLGRLDISEEGAASKETGKKEEKKKDKSKKRLWGKRSRKEKAKPGQPAAAGQTPAAAPGPSPGPADTPPPKASPGPLPDTGRQVGGRRRRKVPASLKLLAAIAVLALVSVGPGYLWPEWNYGLGLVSLFGPDRHYTGRLPSPGEKPARLSDVQKDRAKNLYREAEAKIEGEEIDEALELIATISAMDPGSRLAQKGRQKIYDFHVDKAGEMFEKADLDWYCRYMDRAVALFPAMKLDNLYQRAAKFSDNLLLIDGGDRNAAAVYRKIIREYPEEEYAVEKLHEVIDRAMGTAFAQDRYKEVTESVLNFAGTLPRLTADIYCTAGDAYYTHNLLLSGDKYNAAWMYARALDSSSKNEHARSQLEFILAEIGNRLASPGPAGEKRSMIGFARRNFPDDAELSATLDSLEAGLR